MNLDLFGPVAEIPDVVHFPDAFHSDDYKVEDVLMDVSLKRYTAMMYGQKIQVPRREAWFGDRSYRFGGRSVQPQPLAHAPAWLRPGGSLWLIAEQLSQATFDSLFVNYYADGSRYIAWHADDEPWICEPICSISLGSRRRFVLRHKTKAMVRAEYMLGHGDVLVMKEGVQKDWEHSIRPTKTQVGPRINLTFRRTK